MTESNVPSGLTVELAKAGVTKSKLAELLNVSTKTISRMGDEISAEVRVILNSLKEPEYSWIKVTDEIFSFFDGVGRGTPVKGFVLISRGSNKEDGVVTEDEWKARLDYTCKHGRQGWGCKVCLK